MNFDTISLHRYKKGREIRITKSLDFDELNHSSQFFKQHPSTIPYRKSADTSVDYTSEPVTTNFSNHLRLRTVRPTPPKKPLRLSLQRTQSLQTIESNAAATIMDLERKRAVKRTHRGNKTPELHQCIDGNYLLY